MEQFLEATAIFKVIQISSADTNYCEVGLSKPIMFTTLFMFPYKKALTDYKLNDVAAFDPVQCFIVIRWAMNTDGAR